MNFKSSRSQSPASSQGSVKQTSLVAWLSSPSKLSQNFLDLSQENLSQKCSSFVNAATSLGLSQNNEDIKDCTISFSPLVSDQELFSDDEDLPAGPVKRLFSSKLPTDPLENLEEQFVAKNIIAKSRIKSPTMCNGNDTSAINSEFVQRNGVTCVADRSIDCDNWSECSTPVSEISGWATAQQEAKCCIQKEADELLVSSADGNREEAPLTDSVAAVNVEKEFCIQSSQRFTQQFTNNRTHTKESFTQPSSSLMSPSQAMSSKGMKQMDIGVFFGLKPKAEKVKVPLKTQSQNAGASQLEEKWPRKTKNVASFGNVHFLTDNTGGIPATAPSGTQRRERKRKAVGSLSDADSLTNNMSGVTATAPSGTQNRGWKRFRQNSTAEENKGRKQCPFYKKIPGDSHQNEVAHVLQYFLTFSPGFRFTQ